MPQFEIPARYTRLNPAEGEELTEKNFRHYERQMSFDPSEIALVLVDLWNHGWGPEPMTSLGIEAELNAGRSFCERAKQVTLDYILPALQAARQAGIKVAHAPTRDIAIKYPQWERLAVEPEKSPKSASTPSDWPPREFVRSWREEHRNLSRDKTWITNYYQYVRPLQDIPDPVKPAEEEWVISSGDQLHRLLREHRIKVLFYAGFATNMCILDKPGAIVDMQRRGYLCILLRDATTAVEISETVDELWFTRVFISQIELLHGYSTSSEAFIQAFDTLHE